MLDKLGVEEGEAGELILVEVHHEQLVCGSHAGTCSSKLCVKIRGVKLVFLREKIIIFVPPPFTFLQSWG